MPLACRAVDLVEHALDYAAKAYGDRAELEHPLEVARLVRSAGFPGEVVAAAVLHDLIEDTDVDDRALAVEFGSRVAALVSTMTEDESIPGYKSRKREHRERVRAAGRDVAIVFVADKLSNARRMRRGQKRPDPKKLAHYEATLESMREAYPDLPVLAELESELEALRASAPRARSS